MSEASNQLYEIRDDRFRFLVFGTETLVEHYCDCRWAEGPVWFEDLDCLIWSDIPNQRMLRLLPDGHVSLFRTTDFVNGNTRDRQGRIVSCEHGGRRVIRTEYDGTITVIADRHDGRRLNSPNDVVVKSDGSIWFTDPSYGIQSNYEGYRAKPEQPTCNVYRVDPTTGDVGMMANDFRMPNGLAFSPDESKLYVADSGATHFPDGPHHIRAFDVGADGKLSGGHVLYTTDIGVPDGFRVDVDGNIWTSAGDGIHCVAADGALLGKIRIPQVVANLTFGGPRRNRLFIAATKSLYSVYVGAAGVQRP
ncbi:SMP-30/gluconolactonase/LRE family protein [Rhizobium laguerreae]|uniref:SMP-30/gluconolactonase/LRE family protein n=1 Tax=Rhizobium laguerreae TaxID=1076926 RepID=UPI001C921BDB|nr:SMP-30/gluconolactonase/LRE family protein [Rhizobium laguerreae]MBY3163925.1 SMP-30/gluconolactonase/LRE family protein [Rhizobium laguerreae]